MGTGRTVRFAPKRAAPAGSAIMSEPTREPAPTVLSALEEQQIRRANDSGRVPVVFVHGLWLAPASWDRWAALFEDAGYAALTPGWPGEPPTVAEANAHPERLAGRTLGEVVDHLAAVLGRLERMPVVVGHSFGGLVAQVVAGRGLAAATVAIAPAPLRGVLALPLSALRAAWPVLGSLANRRRAVPLSLEQFRYAFANAVDADEARALHAAHAVPGAGAPLFEAAIANVNPWSAAQVDTLHAARGPLLVMAGERDHAVPPAVAQAAWRLQQHNPGLTEYVELPGRGHSLTIDAGWEEVARTALAFVARCAPADVQRRRPLEAAARAGEERRQDLGVVLA
jgi:pimeloyl-ACP methyl ester carboxylesterase